MVGAVPGAGPGPAEIENGWWLIANYSYGDQFPRPLVAAFKHVYYFSIE